MCAWTARRRSGGGIACDDAASGNGAASARPSRRAGAAGLPCRLAAARTPGAVDLFLGKSGKLGVALDDGFALGVAENVFDVAKAVGRPALDLVDHALRPAPAIVAYDFGRSRQPLRLIGGQRRSAMLG